MVAAPHLDDVTAVVRRLVMMSVMRRQHVPLSRLLLLLLLLVLVLAARLVLMMRRTEAMGGDARSHGNVEAVVVELLTVGEELTTVCVVPRAAQTAAPAAQDLPTNNVHNTV